MADETDDPACLYGDRQSEHRLGRRGCKALDCGCGEFEAAEGVSPGIADIAAEVLGGKSTSARLRDVERQLFETQQLVDQKQQRLLEASDLLTEARAKQEQTERERDEVIKRSKAKTAEIHGLRAELGVQDHELAKRADRIAELEQLLADAGLKLIEQGNEAAAEMTRLRILLEQADKRFSELRAETPPAPAEIYGYDAWLCEVCGSRYRPFHTHPCGPLKPVRVSITERQEHHPQ